ncbi:acyltransferase domain-containing protein [Kitasatospora sp. NPDC003701]
MTVDAVVFPGQGAQRAGMGADLHRRWEVARRTFEEASDAVGEDLARICFEKDERLHLTEFTQPCILTVETAAYRVAAGEFGFAPGLFGGHSLGEYTALVAAGVLPFADAVSLVRTRGALMQQAVPPGTGAMAALILTGIEDGPAPGLVREAGAEVVNHNSPHQVVIGGTAESVERAGAVLAQALPDLTFVRLRVSAPFHSSLMRGAQERFAEPLARCAVRLRPERATSVTSNYTGGFHRPELLVDHLRRQVAGAVRWSDNMRALAERADRIFEIGPGAPLTKFFAALGHPVTPLTTAAHLEQRLPGPAPVAPVPVAPVPVPVPVPLPTPVPAAEPARAVAEAPADGAARLGDPAFLRDRGVRLAYAVGGLPEGITGPELVIALGRAGLLGHLGLGGLRPDRAAQDLRRVRAALPAGAPWGATLTRDPDRDRTAEWVELLLTHDVPGVEAIGFTTPEPALVRLRLTGLRPGPDGSPVPARRLLVPVSHPDTARQFMAPAPEPVVRALRAQGLITDEEARLSARLPMADDLYALPEPAAPLGLLGLLPALRRVRAETAAGRPGLPRVRLGAAGGLGTAEAVAAAFALGADFVLTRSVNQATVEAATSALVKDLLTAAEVGDFATAPAEEALDQGGRVTVLRRGGFFAARSARLYELLLHGEGIDGLDPAEREVLEKQYFGQGLDDVWAQIRSDPARWGAAAIARAERDAGERPVLLVRWYLADTLRRAIAGDPAERLNFQIRSGPAVAAFNREAAGTPLEHWHGRRVDAVAQRLMTGAARVLSQQQWYGDRASAPASATEKGTDPWQ